VDRNRRAFLKHLGCGAAAVGAAPVTMAATADEPRAPEDAVGMLYDTTMCIGCKTCVVACNEANGLPPDTRNDPLHDAPLSLNDRTKNIIKLYREGPHISYMKQQCMHCIDPACVGACMIGALQKRAHGIVTWDGDRCIGCRYCQVACPYSIPKFEWNDATPKIVKCELCDHRIARGQEPACCEVCPRGAVIYGRYEDLLTEARQRQADHPGRYVEAIYGEREGGGTQVLYLSHVPFAKLGLPRLGDEPVPETTRELQHGIYKGFIAPIALYAVLAGVMLRNRRRKPGDQPEEGADHE
jgi:Fe-S-cluster-containing dehydrogenase component